MITDQTKDAILVAFLRGSSPADLAQHFKVPLLELLDWLESPAVSSVFDRLQKLADRQSRLATAHARITALTHLESVALGAAHDQKQSAAACALIRNTPKSLQIKDSQSRAEQTKATGHARTAHEQVGPAEASTHHADAPQAAAPSRAKAGAYLRETAPV